MSAYEGLVIARSAARDKAIPNRSALGGLVCFVALTRNKKLRSDSARVVPAGFDGRARRGGRKIGTLPEIAPRFRQTVCVNGLGAGAGLSSIRSSGSGEV